MNERIRELALQAEQYARDELIERRAVGAPLYAEGEYDNIIKQKFAELIVRECLNVLYANGLYEYDISEVLCDHFGVKE